MTERAGDGGGSVGTRGEVRPWIGVRFLCASSYVRAYRDADGRSYRVRCPRCGMQATFPVAEHGTPHRLFEASCR
ncbi:MAG: hypothetical protein AAFX79_03995 [Planctomycetota bacterium]